MPRPGALAVVALVAIESLAGAQLPPVQEHGAADAWLKLRKLQTTASLMHTTAHPDDEHGGVLAATSLGAGARVSLLTLTRGESGDNAIGPELFDALGLIRTEELRAAGRYYGVDAQYFTTAVDYGFSKRLDEAVQKWGREHVLRDMVAIIRRERPLVVVSRFQGNPRDGHGQHQAAGLLTREAAGAAGNPDIFPEQASAGLRPWKPLKLYIGGVRETEGWTLRVDAGRFDPVLGESYATFGRMGLSLQRSQTGGRFVATPGPSLSYYTRLDSPAAAPAREDSFFDGLDTTISGIYRLLGGQAPPGAAPLLEAIEREIEAAVRGFSFTEPSVSAPALARALQAARTALAQLPDPDVLFILRLKEQQIVDAIHAVLGLRLTAVAQPPGTPDAAGPFAAGPPPMGRVVPGQSFDVRATFTNRGLTALTSVRVTLESTDPAAAWDVTADGAVPAAAAAGRPVTAAFAVRVPDDAAPTRPYFSRGTIQEARYTIAGARHLYTPHAPAPLEVVASYAVDGVPVELRRPVMLIESNIPYGYTARALAVVPAVAVTLAPAHAVIRKDQAKPSVTFTAEVVSNVEGSVDGVLTLEAPPGWMAAPASHPLEFARAGERARFTFTVQPPAADDRHHRVQAVALVRGREYREGYTVIGHRDLETRHLYREAAASIRGLDVRIAGGLNVGYVMGIGDDVPSGLAQLGVEVQLLGAQDLATADLQAFDAIVTGTRAYAVREDLRTYNRRLLDYARDGGNLIVLYNTQELAPAVHAPYPGELPRSAEEVSEEDSPVEILAPEHAVLHAPNRITPADFDGWVEQRGSKFWSAWDSRYTPIIATWDTGQQPQRGGWLHARYGRGHYTYFAYALHRQLPYGVPGAYRILANLLSLRATAGEAPGASGR